jgi:2-oxoisovalerate dehydrogenase E2 component (dihydrolipoyl transacylase)
MGTWTVKLPDVGEGIAEAEVTRWLVDVGDSVRDGDPIVEVMTDKATVELPSPVSGTIEWIGADVGDLVPVGSDLLRLGIEDGSPAGDDDRTPTTTAAQPASPAPKASPTNGHRPAADPFADLTDARRDAPEVPSGRALAAPAVRRRARNLGVDLREVPGNGPEGRIGHDDLDRFVFGRDGADGSRSVGASDGNRSSPSDEVDQVKLTGLRRSIARHMEDAWRHVPHFTYVEEVDVTELQRTRVALEREREARSADGTGETDAPRLGVLPFLMRAVVVALRHHPEMNARFDEAEGVVHRHRAVHLGVAVQTGQGLVVTVARHAEDRDVHDCAAELARLSDAARSGRATLEELRGSTITISNLGTMGGVVSAPIVNHPEVAIIGVNKIARRPVEHDGVVVVREVMNLSSSFDHRVVDGWDAANFVQRIKALLETPALLFSR